MANWLAKQKKVELNDLAAQAGFSGATTYKKDDLIPALDKHIQSNSSTLASNSAFAEYFEETDVKPKSRARRVTKAAAESMYVDRLDIMIPMLMIKQRSVGIKPRPRNNSNVNLSVHTHTTRPAHGSTRSSSTIAIRRDGPRRAPDYTAQQ